MSFLDKAKKKTEEEAKKAEEESKGKNVKQKPIINSQHNFFPIMFSRATCFCLVRVQEPGWEFR